MIGRLLDENNKPLSGAMISNHMSKTFSENDGFFSIDVNKRHPDFIVEHNGSLDCKSEVKKAHVEETDVMMLGDIICSSRAVVKKDV